MRFGFLDKFLGSVVKYRKDTLLHIAVRTNDIDLVRFFLNENIDTIKLKGRNRYVGVLRFFKERDCRKYLSKKNKYGYTPLHLAIKDEAQREIIEELINHMNKEDLNIKNDNGETALHLAVFCRRFDIAKLLIRKGADVNVRDKYSKTIVHDVVRTMNAEILEFLLKEGVDLYSTDSNGRIPLERACGYLKSAKSFVASNELEEREKNEKVKCREKIVCMLDNHMREEMDEEFCRKGLEKKDMGFTKNCRENVDIW